MWYWYLFREASFHLLLVSCTDVCDGVSLCPHLVPATSTASPKLWDGAAHESMSVFLSTHKKMGVGRNRSVLIQPFICEQQYPLSSAQRKSLALSLIKVGGGFEYPPLQQKLWHQCLCGTMEKYQNRKWAREQIESKIVRKWNVELFGQSRERNL